MRNPRGAVMVEMALVITIFLMIVLGIAEFGYAFMVTQAMVTAAREGARLAAVTENLQVNDPRVLPRCLERLVSAGIRNGECENTKPIGPRDLVTCRVHVRYNLITGNWFNRPLSRADWDFKREATMLYEEGS